MTHLAPHDLTIDFGGDQFPVSEARPRLSWIPSADAPSFEIQSVVDDVPMPPTQADEYRFVRWPWGDLPSRARVKWRVRARGGAWSLWHAFEIGLLGDDWTADWITPVELAAEPGHRPAYELSTPFTAREDVVRARLYSTALGVYEAFVNGERVGDAELAPGSTSYDLTAYAQAADVGSLVHPGANELRIVVSDGWYRGQVGAFREPAGWGEQLAVRAELHLDLADGSTRIVRSGRDWMSAPTSITRADLMDGQTSDFTMGPASTEPVQLHAGAHPQIRWSPAPPVRVVATRSPAAIHAVSGGAAIVDFGQNASGWVRLSALGARGQRTVIDYGEHLAADGELDTSHLDATEPGMPPIPFVQRDEVVSSGAAGEVFEPRHTVHGFRYARLSHPDGSPVQLTDNDVQMQVVHTDLRRAGSLTTSSTDLNRLLTIADWSFVGNAVDVPTDCPTRERLGWTGDYQIFAPTAVRLYDVLGFTRKWLQSVRDDQLADGRITNFSPDGRRVKRDLHTRTAMMTGSAGWGDAIVAVPWTMWQTYGDREILAENWDAMTRWVEWALGVARSQRHPSRVQRSAEPEPHEQYLWDASFHWGEWAEPAIRQADGTLASEVQADPMAWFTADKSEVATAFLFRSTDTLAAIARELGRTEDAVRYADLAEHIRDAWQREHLRADGRTTTDTQAAYVRALAFGLVPAALIGPAVNRLVELIRDADIHLGTGFLSTADLLPVLADNGHAGVAYELLFQRSTPSWLGMLDRGATTIWEDWDGISLDGTARDSLNHYSKGAVVRFLHTHVLGLRQAAGGVAWRRVLIAPVLGGGLTSARGHFDSPQGRIEAAWTIADGVLEVDVRIPSGSHATIVLPDGTEHAAGPGRTVVNQRLGHEGAQAA